MVLLVRRAMCPQELWEHTVMQLLSIFQQVTFEVQLCVSPPNFCRFVCPGLKTAFCDKNLANGVH